jgi:sporulation protein YlmC with PRC-barrel domain
MKVSTAANATVLAIASALGLPDGAHAESGAQVRVGPAAVRVAGPISGQPQPRETLTQDQSQSAEPDHKAPPALAQGQAGQNDQKQPGTIQARQPDAVLVSNLLNASVYGPNDSTIGEIEDIIIKTDGKVEGVVVSVGGFLGLGEKNVALKLDRFKLTPQAEGRPKITVRATKEELQEAPAFKTKRGQGS